ncbi:MAG: InlB B-repeat-containing protein [Oscillospiraceae bacterium]|nr:InlB B-repeat-containing protein [Oscillospiraceae bacterium]
MKKFKIGNMSRTTIGIMVVVLTVLYLFGTAALAQTSPKASSNTGYSYSADALSWGDVYAFDSAAFSGTNYSKVSGTTTNKTYYNNSTQSNSGTGTWAMPAYVGKVTYGNHAAPSNVTAMTAHTLAQFRSNVSTSTIASPVDSSVTIPVATTTGTGIYSVVPGSTGSFVVYVYSTSGTPSNVKYALIDSYTAANSYSGAPATALTFTRVGSTDWYYSNSIAIDHLGWYCYKPDVTTSSNSSNSGDTGTGTKTGGSLSNTTLGSTTYYHNTWSAEQTNFDTVLCLSFPSSVKLGPITKANGTFSLSNDSTKGSVSVRNIFGVDVGTSYSGVHIPLFISATPNSGEYSFTGVEGGTVSVVSEGLYRFDFEGTASLTSKWERMVNLPTVTVGSTTLDAYFTNSGSASFQNGTDTTFTFSADFSNAVSGATLGYSVTGSTTGIDTSGTLTASNNTFSLVASFDSVTVTFKAAGDGVTKTMTYTITGTDAGLAKVARIGTSSGTNEYYRLEDALLASNNGTSGNIYMIANYTMYSGEHPRTAWTALTGSNQKGYHVKSGVTLVVPYSTSTTIHTTSPATVAAATISHYRTLTVPGGVDITVAGAVSVDSQVNQANGMSTGPHGLVVMQAGSSMTFSGSAKLYCWGYINGDGNVIMQSGTTVYECFKLGNWRGGSATSGMLNNDQKVFPINQYFVQNIEAPLTIYAGAVEKLFSCVTVSVIGTQTTSPTFITSGSATDGMFRISSGYITKRYLPTTDHLLIECHGVVSINSLTISVAGYSMDSSKYVLPITNNLDVTVADGGTVTAGQDLCFLAGAVLTIDHGGTFVIPSGKNVYVYDLTEWNSGNYATSTATMVVVGYSTANGTTTMRTKNNLGDATINVNGTLQVDGKLYTTESGAKIYSSEGHADSNNGRIVFNSTAATSPVTTYQATQSDTNISYPPITCNNAWLQNGDGTYSQTVSTGTSTFYYDKAGEHWYRYLVEYQYKGNTVGKGFYCENNETLVYDASWLGTLTSATCETATVTPDTVNKKVSVTSVVADSVVTLLGDAYAYKPVFVLNETQYAAYRSYTGNTLTATRTINGATYYVLKAASSPIEVGTTHAAPTDEQMGITAEHHNGIVWNMSGVSATSGDPYMGVVPAGATPNEEVYIYGFYTGFVAYNSFTDEYYTTLAEAMSFVPQSGTTTVTMLANCGTFETESRTALFTTYPAANVTLNLNGFTAWGRINNQGNMTLELNGGTLDYHTGATAAASTYRTQAAVINSGTLTVQDSVGGGKITTDIASENGTTNHAATIRNNGGTVSISNVNLEMTQMYNANNAVVMNYNGGTMTMTDLTLSSGYGYCVFNYGGTISSISNVTMTGSYGINNRNLRGSNAISAGYNISKVGTIEVVENSNIEVGQYAIYNGGRITTLSNSTFKAHPDSAQVDTLGNGTTARHGNTQCYTVFNSANWWFDTNVWKRVDTTAYPYTRTETYKEEEDYRPTINTITNCTIIAENTSTSADHGCALYNSGGVIGTISGGVIQTKKHENNGENIASNYALRNTAGGIIKSITGNVTISATGNSAVYNDGQFTTQTINKYSDKIAGIQIHNNTTYGQPSEITSITASGTISAGSTYGIMNSGYIGTINSTGLMVQARYSGILNSGSGAVQSYEYERKYTNETDATTEYERVETYVRNLETGGYIGTINGIILQNTGSKGYFAMQNQGHIGTISNVTVGLASTATAYATADYPLFLNGDSRQTNYTLTRVTNYSAPNLTVSSGIVTRYDYEYNYGEATIDLIDNVSVISSGAYAFENRGKITMLKDSTITGSQYSLVNYWYGSYDTIKVEHLYSGTSLFATTKTWQNTTNSNKDYGDQAYYYTRIPAEITTIDNCTITTPANTYALKNGGHIGTIKNSTITAGTTTAKAMAIYNGEARVRSYSINLDDWITVIANGGGSNKIYFGMNGESKVVTYDYDMPEIDLIGEGNTISATTTVIENHGVIHEINSGDGELTTITGSSSKGSTIYNVTAVLESRTTTTPYTAAASTPGNGTAGTAANDDTYHSGAQIGTIKNVFINANGYGILNGSAAAGYLPTIGEIGEGTEIYAHCTSAGYHAIYNQANAKITEISGGVYTTTTATTNAYKNNNTAAGYATLISGGDFKGMAVGRGNAIFEPDNTSRQTYITGKNLSKNPHNVNFNNGTTVESGSGYYYLAEAFTVTFDMQGHGTAPADQTVETDQKATEPTAPTAEGYRFDGWYTEDTFTTLFDFDTPITADNTDPVTKTLTLYAKWKTDITGATVTVSGTYTYTGSAITPDVANISVVVNDTTLTNGTDYNFTVTNNINAGNNTATVTVTGTGNYGGTATGTFTIAPKAVTVSGITASNKIYDGTTTATLDITHASFTGIVSGDTLTISSANGTFINKNVGIGKKVNIGGLTLGGASAGNYVLADSGSQTETTANITAKSVTITGLSASNKIYDGTVTASLTGTATLEGVITGDTVTLDGTPTASFSDQNVGTGKSVTVSGYGLSGADADNYSLTQPTGLTANITARAVTVSGITASEKTYDGTTTATLDTTHVSFAGIVSDDTLTVTATGTFNDKNVGTGKTVTISGLTLGGASAGNYELAATGQQVSTTAIITTKAVTITGLGAEDKAYDGTANASVTGTAVVNGKVDGDAVTVTAGTASFDNENVGTGKTVSFTGYSLSGADAGNYSLSDQPASVTASITAKALTITGLGAENKSYDGTANATVTGTASLEGVLDGETVTVAAGSARFDNKNVGEGKTVTFTGYSLSGADASNYTLAAQPASTTASITPKAVTITGLSASNKEYDGTTAATAAGTATIDGKVAGDTVTVTAGTASFADKTVGENKTVTFAGYGLSGADAGNYTLSSQPASTTASITPKSITITGLSASDKEYDGTTVVIVSGTAELVGVLDGESVELNVASATASFADKNVGTDKPVTFTGYDLSGADAGNYVLSAQPASVTANITPKSVTITGLGASDKTYDGTTTATVTGTATVDGKLDGDTVTVTAGSASFDNKNVGTGKTVTFTGYSLSGADAGNYTLSAQPASTTANITAKSVTITGLGAEDKVYDGNTNATVTGAATIDGKVDGDDLSVTAGSASFDNKNIGTGKTVTFSGYSLSGADAGNYTLSAQPASVTASITAKALTITGLGASDKTYDGTANATVTGTATLNGIVGEEDVSFTSGSANFADADVGTGKTVTFMGYSLSGADAGNYSLTQPASVTADITKASLTVTAKPNTITYGDAPTNDGVTYSGFVTGEDESVLGGTLEYAYSYEQFGDVDDYTITPSGLTSSNYEISFVAGTLTVEQKTLTITWSTDPIYYDSTEQAPTASVSGMVNNDEIGVTVGGAASAVGDHTATATLTGAKAGNYMPDPNTCDFTIIQTYTVIWKNGETTLKTDEYVHPGVTPEYTGTTTPTQDGSGIISYLHSGWKTADGAEIAPAAADVTYIAQFDTIYSIKLDYTTQVEENGTTTTIKDYTNTGVTIKYNDGKVEVSEPSIRYYNLNYWTINNSGSYDTDGLASTLKTMVESGDLDSTTTVKAFFLRQSVQVKIYSITNGGKLTDQHYEFTAYAGRSFYVNSSATVDGVPFSYWKIGPASEYPDGFAGIAQVPERKTSYFVGENPTENNPTGEIMAIAYFTGTGQEETIDHPKVTLADSWIEGSGESCRVGMTVSIVAPPDVKDFTVLTVGFGYVNDDDELTAHHFTEAQLSDWAEKGWTSGTFTRRYTLDPKLYTYGYVIYQLGDGETYKVFVTTTDQCRVKDGESPSTYIYDTWVRPEN